MGIDSISGAAGGSGNWQPRKDSAGKRKKPTPGKSRQKRLEQASFPPLHEPDELSISDAAQIEECRALAAVIQNAQVEHRMSTLKNLTNNNREFMEEILRVIDEDAPYISNPLRRQLRDEE